MIGVSEMHILSLHFWAFEGRFVLTLPKQNPHPQRAWEVLSCPLSINIQDSRSQPSLVCQPRH